MKLLKLLQLHAFSGKPRFIFLNDEQAAAAAARRAEEDDDDEDPLVREDLLERRRERQQRSRQEMTSRIERSRAKSETKQLMREDLASDRIPEEEKFDRADLIDRYLNGEIDSEEKYIDEREKLLEHYKKWHDIFERQRAIRKKIQEVQYRAESYVELIPRKKLVFEGLLKQARGLNNRDEKMDRGLTETLHALTLGNTEAGGRGVLDAAAAREIYEVNPLTHDFSTVLNRHKGAILGAPKGEAVYRKLSAYKREEAQIEREYNSFYNKFQKVLAENLNKTRKKLEKERLLEIASTAIGITLKEGTVLEFENPDILAFPSTAHHAKIARIEWDDVEEYDADGHVINIHPGIPFISIVNGATRAEMPLGRFKKWVDATDATEVIGSIEDLERATGLAAYGIKMQKGIVLTYPKRTKDREGNIQTTMQYTRVTDIKNGAIFFDEPVLYNPGVAPLDAYDYRESLKFAEFAKWWHRYEVEKSVSLEELRDLLIIYNDIENQAFGLEASTNQPILILKGEELRYPDEGGAKFRIIDVGPDGVTLDDSTKYTFPQFFYWVKKNHVEKSPEQEKTAEEKAAAEKKEHAVERFKHESEEEAEKKVKIGMEREIGAEKHKAERLAGSPLAKLRDVWYQTQFLSLKDLWNIVKEVMEFVKRKHERRSKGRYGEVGSRLPWIVGTEFERVKQAAENEEVNKYKEAMEHWDIEKVKSTLHRTNSKDEAKACIMTLIHKGEMRWDDHELWESLNRLTSRYTMRGAELYIPKPSKMAQGTNAEEMVVHACDALWGKGTGTEWVMENTNKYNSNKNSFEYEFKQLENDPRGTGGPKGLLKEMLKAWKAGKYINPMRYEAMIDGAVKFGKMGAEDKMFYIIAGVLMTQGNKEGGETLLHFDRIGELNSKHSNAFPLMDFFTQEMILDMSLYDDKKKKWGKERKIRLEDLENWMREYYESDYQKCEPGSGFSRFMWEKMLMSDVVKTRITKGIRNAENMDHDDAHLYIPPTTPSEIEGLTTGPTGQKKYFTNEGYANAYPGFGHYIVSLSHAIEDETNGEKKKGQILALRDSISAFIRFDAILDNRLFKSEGDRRARLDDRNYERRTVVDSAKLRLHQTQMRNLVVEIGKAYGHDWSGWLYVAKTGSIFDPEEKRKQKEYEMRIDTLKDTIPQMIAEDDGKKALEVVKRFRDAGIKNSDGDYAIRGLPGSRRPKDEDVAAMKQKAKEYREAKMHGGGGH